MKIIHFSRLQLAAGLVVALAVAACGYYWLYLEQSHQRLHAGTVERIEQQSAQLAGAVSRQMALLAHLIDSAVIRMRDAWATHSERAYQETAEDMINNFPPGAVPQIGFIDGQGYLNYSSVGITERIYVGDREHFKVHANSTEDRLFISHPVLGRATKAWSIQFTRPIRQQEQFAGVVIVSISPDYIAQSLLLPESGADDVISVLYLDGAFASRTRYIDDALGTSVPLDRPFVGVDAPLSGTIHLTSVIDGVRRIYSWRRLDEFPLVVTVGLAEAPILEPVEQSIREARKRVLISITIILALATGIAALLFRVGRDERALHESERFLDSIVENIPAMLFIKDAANLRFVKFNRAGEELLGYSRHELIGRSDYDFFPKEEADFFTAKDREVLAALSVVDIPEEPIRTKFGPKILHTRKIGIADREGKPKFLIGISVDATERNLLESLNKIRRLILETLASDQPLNAILAYVSSLIEQQSPEALCSILLLDSAGRHLLHGAAPSLPEFYNQALNGIAIGPEIGSCGAAAFSGTRVIVEDVMTHPYWASFADLARQAGLRSCWSEPIRAADGKILGVFALYHRNPCVPDTKDLRLIEFAAETISLVIERKQTEAELASYRLKLEDQVAIRTRDLVLARDLAETANRAKSAFLSNMSHELRTPLNAVLGFSELLLKDPLLTPIQRENLDIINRSGAHLLNLINDILDMVKIETGRVQIRQAPFDLTTLVGDIAGTLRVRAAEKGLQLRLDPSAQVPRYVRGDETKLRQILINLIDNAIKFTPQGEVVLCLDMLPNPGGVHLSIKVKDSGIGIAPEDRTRIFDPFVQVSAVDTQKGTGLGLAIARQFVESLGGRISVTSQLGQGSCFQVDLPIEPVEEAEARVADIDPREIVGLEPDQPDHRILIVDDQPENALLLKQLLEKVGFRVRIAEDGERGVELFQSWHPDFIWMDWRMPVLDGLEATRRIRAAADGRTVKIVAITASVLPEQQAEILAAGVDDIIHKPYPLRAIFDGLARHLGVRYVYQERAATSGSATGITLTPAALADLPEDIRQELADALVALDCARIDQLIARIAERDAALGQAMRRYADNFDYGPIEEALRNGV